MYDNENWMSSTCGCPKKSHRKKCFVCAGLGDPYQFTEEEKREMSQLKSDWEKMKGSEILREEADERRWIEYENKHKVYPRPRATEYRIKLYM